MEWNLSVPAVSHICRRIWCPSTAKVFTLKSIPVGMETILQPCTANPVHQIHTNKLHYGTSKLPALSSVCWLCIMWVTGSKGIVLVFFMWLTLTDNTIIIISWTSNWFSHLDFKARVFVRMASVQVYCHSSGPGETKSFNVQERLWAQFWPGNLQREPYLVKMTNEVSSCTESLTFLLLLSRGHQLGSVVNRLE